MSAKRGQNIHVSIDVVTGTNFNLKKKYCYSNYKSHFSGYLELEVLWCKEKHIGNIILINRYKENGLDLRLEITEIFAYMKDINPYTNIYCEKN